MCQKVLVATLLTSVQLSEHTDVLVMPRAGQDAHTEVLLILTNLLMFLPGVRKSVWKQARNALAGIVVE